MYGGLFGDLPATKQQQQSQDGDASGPRNEEDVGGATIKPTGDTNLVETNKTPNDSNNNSNKKKTPPTTNMFLPMAARKQAKTNHPQGGVTSISQAVGAAGTTMAFVPTNVQRQRLVAKTVEQPPKKATIRKTAIAPSSPTTQGFVTTTTTVIQSAVQGPIDIHGSGTTTNTGAGDQQLSSSLQTGRPMSESAAAASMVVLPQPPLEEITDPYDPLVPNDLLHYWEEQKIAHQQRQLQQEAQQALEDQRQLRAKLEQERQALEEQGDYHQIVAQREAQRQRTGRGRGVSNLPAWLVEKQKREGGGVGSAN